MRLLNYDEIDHVSGGFAPAAAVCAAGAAVNVGVNWAGGTPFFSAETAYNAGIGCTVLVATTFAPGLAAWQSIALGGAMDAVAAGAANVATQAAAEGKQEDNKTGGKVADKK